jgi:hypothetical protein
MENTSNRSSFENSSTSPSKFIPFKQDHRTKFRYIIHGVPRNKRYTIEEARWCDSTNQFISEKTHTLYAITLKQWLGYIPSTLGDITTIMWMGFPSTSWDSESQLSPLDEWGKNKDLFIPHNLEKFRFFPQGSCHEQASQIKNIT